MAKAKASGFKGYTQEEVEAEGKKDLLVLKEMLGEQQVSRTLLSCGKRFPIEMSEVFVYLIIKLFL